MQKFAAHKRWRFAVTSYTCKANLDAFAQKWNVSIRISYNVYKYRTTSPRKKMAETSARIACTANFCI